MKISDSVFNKMSDKQWKRLEKEQGWTVDKKVARELDKLIAEQEAEEALRQQTEMFWLLQMQFLSMDRFTLGCLMLYYSGSSLYKRNKHSIKAKRLADNARWELPYTEEDHECLATHLALQLAGVEE